MSQSALPGNPIDGRRGLGWLPDYPDLRDYTTESEEIGPLLAKTAVNGAAAENAPGQVDLREWCSPIEDQGQIGSCTAHAGCRHSRVLPAQGARQAHRCLTALPLQGDPDSRPTRGDSGAFLRTTIGAMVLFGVPPEDHWPYSETEFDEDAPAFCYAFAQNYRAIQYYRLDPPGADRAGLLDAIKSHLASQLPSMFGFTVYGSISQSGRDGKIPFPSRGDRVEGGHAVVAVGYDDSVRIGGGDSETEGAFLIRNSWGRGWGDDGYGWLPYEYVRRGLASDWWVLIENGWVDTGEFMI